MDRAVGCERPDGTLNIHPEQDTCEICLPQALGFPTIIAGPRHLTPSLKEMRRVMREAEIIQGIRPTMIISGAARGVDLVGEQWAIDQGLPIRRFLPDYDQYTGVGVAPMIRNVEMVEAAKALVAIWDGESKGTRHVIHTARQEGLKVHVLVSRDDGLLRQLTSGPLG